MILTSRMRHNRIAAGLNAARIKGKAGGRFYASTIAKVLRALPAV